MLSHPALTQMNKQQLIEFMIKKGNERKRDQADLTQALTSDSQDKIASIISHLESRVAFKKTKLKQFDDQRRNYEIEISGLEIAQTALKQKIKKREDQLHQTDMLVKGKKNELRQIMGVITPKLVGQLYKTLSTKDIPKIN